MKRIKVHPQSAPGRYYVDCDTCHDHGICADLAPANFRHSEETPRGYFVCKQPENEQEERRCREALAGCPMSAIRDDGEYDDVDKLLESLTEAIALLRKVKESGWADWLEKNHARIVRRDFSGVEGLLGGFGGMGSFNDLVLHPLNGHELGEQEITPINAHLRKLSNALYLRAVAIKREVERE